MATVRVGILGCGGYAGRHARDYLQNPDVQVVALCDLSEDIVAAFCEKHFAEAKKKPGGIEKLISAYGKKAGLKRCYAHKLRHTSSVMYLRNGGDVFSLQKKLGHRSLVMTRHYSNLADSDVRAQHLRYGVADRLKF